MDKFNSATDLHSFIRDKRTGTLLIQYRNMPDYPGMVLGIAIIYNVDQGKFELDLQWICFGLDLYGENLLENYLYSFSDLATLLEYIQDKYNVSVSDIPVKYTIDANQFPDPIRDADKKAIYGLAWDKFQEDFREGLFLDNTITLVYSTVDHSGNSKDGNKEK